MQRNELIGLQLALVPILVQWEKMCVRARGAEPIDVDTVELYAESLAEIRITPDELTDARRAMLRDSKYFPTISDISAYVLAHRDSNPYRGWICCEDADGLPWVAPAHQVLNGIYVPSGGGNGLSLPPREEREGDREKAERLLNARDVRRPLALGLPTRQSVTPEQEKELLEQARRTRIDRKNERENASRVNP